MLHFELLADRGVLLLSPEGPLEASDFERVAAAVDPVIARDGRLVGILLQAKGFPGWSSFAALVSHLRFVRDHHRKIARVSVATDGAVLARLPAIAAHFVTAEVRRFAYDDRELALAWLAEAPAARP